MKALEVIATGKAVLNNNKIENPSLESRWILAFILDIAPTRLYLNPEISKMDKAEFDAAIARRCAGEPIQLILGEWEFFGRRFTIKSRVFIPRPETEGLVELVLGLLDINQSFEGLEVGVGSGVISISILSEMPSIRMTGTDINQKALESTSRNAESNSVSDRLSLYLTDNFKPEEKFDFIVSNPPYVLSSEMRNLHREVKFDPPEALDGGPDGLDVIRSISIMAQNWLNPKGFIALEIHEESGVATAGLFPKNGFLTEIHKDIHGKDRYLLAFKE
ncbi:peptide chain release factor N(5)-glutamine methyltransferase [bacterium]|nr:peptide chain release factor N(5)-glutamine methyltransferase [bacterium]